MTRSHAFDGVVHKGYIFMHKESLRAMEHGYLYKKRIEYTMMWRYSSEVNIVFPATHRQVILGHCHRALEAYQNGQAGEGKAFGLLFGTFSGQVITVTNCFSLHNNVRSQSPFKEYIDNIMEKYAVPSQTPLDKRGWVADPAELFARIKVCRSKGQVLLGTYHMHRVGWEHDSRRDTPTTLDTVLATDSEMIMFIVSMVEPSLPVIRAFYEGKKEQEIKVESQSLHSVKLT